MPSTSCSSFSSASQPSAGLQNARSNAARAQVEIARLGYLAEFGAHQFQLNLRNDHYRDFGSASTWYAGYGWRFAPAWRLSATASTGFNAPTFNDLYYPYGGNANLRPERVKSRELALQWAVDGREWRATLFDNRFTDLIASGQIEHRLYLRARLALSGLTHADEASSAEQARDWMKAQHYGVTLLDFQLPGAGGWDFVRELTRFGPEPQAAGHLRERHGEQQPRHRLPRRGTAWRGSS